MATDVALIEDEVESGLALAPAVMQLSRAEISEQIATARAFPRNLSKVLAKVEKMATANEEIAAGCHYSLPVGGKNIEGPSIRLAEIFVTCWGNLRVQTLAIDSDGEFVTAAGMALDLETNSAISVQTKRRIVTKKDRRNGGHLAADKDDIQKATNIALSIAFRNAVFKIVPRVFVEDVYRKVREVALGNAESFGSIREKMFGAYAKMGITKDRIVARLELQSEHDLTPDHVLNLRSLFQQIRSGETPLDEAFPEPKPDAGPPNLAGKKLDTPPAGAAIPTAPQALPSTTTAPATAPKSPKKRDEKPAGELPGMTEQRGLPD